jgi:hypothetical protein
MRDLKHACLLAAIALTSMAGCSDENATAPSDMAASQFSSLAQTIGPSEIVLCVDVSDSVSTVELQTVVGALETCLANPELIPQAGRVSIGLLVYGDTIATVLAPPVRVTATSLQDDILPVLAGLLEERPVAGDGFDLAGALNEAQAILAASSVQDQHVLIAGSGAADDGTAVAAACTALGEAGIMISALAIGDDAEGSALLQECVEATGGFFGPADGSLEQLCAEALRYMLVVELNLIPESAELLRGEEIALMATAFRGVAPETYPLIGHDVDFAVVSGPDEGLMGTVATDTTGEAPFSYTGAGDPGQDVVVATTIHPGTGVTLADTSFVTWVDRAPVCDAGGPYTVVVQTDTALMALDGSGSSDPDGDAFTFAWSVDCADAAFDDPALESPTLTLTGSCLCADSLTVTLSVSDGFETSVCQAMIRTEDRRPPIVVTIDHPLQIWPPDHKYRTLLPGMFLDVTNACGEPITPVVTLLEVRSDEPENELGDGATLEDILVDCPDTVRVRAERAGGGDGRIYTIVYRVSYNDGDFMDVEVQAVVPHDQSGRLPVLHDGEGYTYEADCGGVDR